MSRITRAASLSIFCIWLLFKNLDNSFLSFEYLIYPNTPFRFDENFSRSSSVTYTFSDYLIRFCLFILYTYFYIKVNIFWGFIIFLFSNVPKRDCTLKSTIPFLLCICFHYIYSLYFLFTFASFYDEEYNHEGCDCADCDPHYDWIIIAGLCAL